jgi:hypothetical protein
VGESSVFSTQPELGLIEPPWENPARWRGHLSNLLPKRHTLSRGHHPAIPYSQAPEFIKTPRERQSTATLALELAILCAN